MNRSSHCPRPTTDGDKQASTKVDLSASVGLAPAAFAELKWLVRSWMRGVSRSPVMPIRLWTKSAIAAVELLLK